MQYQWRDAHGTIHDDEVRIGKTIYSLMLFLERQARGMVVGTIHLDLECTIEECDDLIRRRLEAMGVKFPQKLPANTSNRFGRGGSPRLHRVQVRQGNPDERSV